MNYGNGSFGFQNKTGAGGGGGGVVAAAEGLYLDGDTVKIGDNVDGHQAAITEDRFITSENGSLIVNNPDDSRNTTIAPGQIITVTEGDGFASISGEGFITHGETITRRRIITNNVGAIPFFIGLSGPSDSFCIFQAKLVSAAPGTGATIYSLPSASTIGLTYTIFSLFNPLALSDAGYTTAVQAIGADKIVYEGLPAYTSATNSFKGESITLICLAPGYWTVESGFGQGWVFA